MKLVGLITTSKICLVPLYSLGPFFPYFVPRAIFMFRRRKKEAEPLNCIQLCCSCLVHIETRNFGS